jgi:hypothetical protein
VYVEHSGAAFCLDKALGDTAIRARPARSCIILARLMRQNPKRTVCADPSARNLQANGGFQTARPACLSNGPAISGDRFNESS